MATRQNTVSTKTAIDGKKIAKARADGKYIVLPGGKLAELGGAFLKWKKPETEDFVYIPSLRMAGLPNDLLVAITSFTDENGIPYSVEDANNYIQSGYNRYNINIPEEEGGKMEQFDAESEERAAVRQRKANLPTVPDVTLADIPAILASLKNKQGAKAVARPRQGSPTSPGTGRGRILPLAERIQKLTPGKVLDVSNMRADGGDIRAITIPGPTSAKIGVDIGNYPIVSSNAANYAAAVRAVYQNAQELINLYNQRLAQTNAPVARPKNITTNVQRQPTRQNVQIPQSSQVVAPVQPIAGFGGIQQRAGIPQASAIGAPRIGFPVLNQFQPNIPQIGSD